MKKNNYYALFLGGHKKLLLMMKIFIVLSTLFSMAITANTYSQKNVSLDMSNAKIKDIFKAIEGKSNYRFFYNDELTDVNKTVTLTVNEGSIENILNRLFTDTDVSYTVLENNLVVVAPKRSIFQGVKISGAVNDASSGEPLPGVNITVQGTTLGTVTDIDGKYSIDAPNANSILIFSFVGYVTETIPLSGNSKIDVNLVPDIKSLEEVIVVGYGQQKKVTATGSITSVKGDDIIKSPTMNVSNSLEGRLPGLVTITTSGEPGYDGTTLRIRGSNTLGNNNPLIVVDGVPGRSLERIDASTIENISVLKDASAAIYGAQAANGVILITTKRGKVGKPTISANFNQGYSRPTRIPKMANAFEYATLLNEVDQYDGKTPRYSADQLQKYQDGSDPWNYPNTDWFKETLKPWSRQNYANLSVSGGSENMKYYVSFGTKSQDGFYYNSGTKYNQYDLRTNLDGNVNKYISIGVDVSGRMEDRNFPTRSASDILEW